MVYNFIVWAGAINTTHISRMNIDVVLKNIGYRRIIQSPNFLKHYRRNTCLSRLIVTITKIIHRNSGTVGEMYSQNAEQLPRSIFPFFMQRPR